jgi:hypothetical protein
MFMTRTVTFVLVVAALAACGSDGDDNGAPKRSAVTKTTYVASVDAICAQANKKEAAAGAPGPGWVYQPAFDDIEFLEKFNAAGREAVRKLRTLEPPKGQREGAAAMVGAIAAMVRAIDGRIHDLRAGKGDASDRVKAYLDGYSDLTPVAAVLGVSECQGVSL